MAMNSTQDRGQWSGGLGFILAAAGSAVGLGNIWRFPYMTGENGGAAFVIVYILCVVLIALPLLFNEVALGRLTGKNPIGAIQSIKPGSVFLFAPILSIILCFVVLSYYSVIAGWTIGYIFTSLANVSINFNEFISTPMYIIPLVAVFIAMTVYIVQGGVSGGIEKWSKILMPLLLVLILVVAIRSLTLPGAMKGVEYYLVPDFSKINGKVLLAALGQAFFSMSVGWGLMITYGSYLPKGQNIISAGIWIALADSVVALLGGLMVFPAVFAFGKSPKGGPTLVFDILPEIFRDMPAGNLVGAGFFLLLCVAALTSSVSMLEVPVSYFVDEKKWNRKKAAWIVGGLAFLLGIPSALSQGGSSAAVPFLANMKLLGATSFLDILDYIFGTVSVVVISLLLSVFSSWAVKSVKVVDELEQGAPFFKKKMLFGLSPANVFVFFIKYICPVVIAIMIVKQVQE